MKPYVMYVPGLTDKAWHIRSTQRAALALWRLSGVRARYFVADWADKHESYEHKLGRLTHLITSLHHKGYRVSLVGCSAGSSLALNAFAECRTMISSFVSICGMIKHPKAVDEAVFAFNKAFKPSMLAAAGNEALLTRADRDKILIVRAGHDSYVPAEHGAIAQAHTTTLPTIGHVFTIFMAITIFRRRILRFVKQASKAS